MGQPIWQVRNSDLGTIAENIYFEYELIAIDTDSQPVTYSLIAGTLPPGIQIVASSLAGIPLRLVGVAADVDIDTSSKFSIRATSTTQEVSDITLDLTVSGQKIPKILTVAGPLAEFYYGNYVDIQLDAIDLDLNNNLTWQVVDDALPAGLKLIVDVTNDRIAYIQGFPVPVSSLPIGTLPGFDASDFDQDLGAFGLDFGLGTIDKNFSFTISLTDGISFDSKTYSILLKSKFSLTADNSDLTADSLEPTADITPKISPILLNEVFDLGTVLHDDYYAQQFTGLDFEGDQLAYREYTDAPGDPSALPAGLSVNSVTGWLHGTITSITSTQKTFTFRIVAYKVAYPDIVSIPAVFTLNIISNLSNSLIWNTPYSMAIDNGAISELSIVSTPNFASDFNINADSTDITADQQFPTVDIDTTSGISAINLVYSLESGNLPIGLALTSTGLIIGRPSFTHYTLDGGTTTLDGGFTNFDNTFTFTVNVIDNTLGIINLNKTFSITVNPLNDGPYENLYMVSKASIPQRTLYSELINDVNLIPPAAIYRAGDSYFGTCSDLRFLAVDGLAIGTLAQYGTALAENHHTKRFRFSELKIAQAYNNAGEFTYEVIYADVVDRNINNGKSISNELIVSQVQLADLNQRGATPEYDTDGNIVIHPASLINMRDRIISKITQNNLDTLPDWMTTTQTDGRVLGFIFAVPIVYCIPGQAKQVLFDINASGFDINKVNFDVDRYTWDNNMTTLSSDVFFEIDATQANFNNIAPNGSFTGGDGIGGTTYAISDTIALSNGTIITVNAIADTGDVAAFTITTIGTNVASNITLTQTASSGTGTGFQITPIRQADERDDDDAYLKFAKQNVFQ
jgi:hypothetical protein